MLNEKVGGYSVYSGKMEITLSHHKRGEHVNSDEVGVFLTYLRKLIVSLTLSEHYEKRTIPNDIMEKNTLIIDSFKKKPVTLIFSAGFQGNYLQTSLIGINRNSMVFYLFYDLLSFLLRPKELLKSIENKNKLTKKYLLDFLSVVVKNYLVFQVTITGECGRVQSSIPLHFSEQSLSILREHDIKEAKTFEYIGTLVGVNVEKDEFQFIHQDDNSEISGKLAKALKSKEFEIPKRVTVKISEQEQINKMTLESKVKYTLEYVYF